MQIYVDADACPVKAEVVRVATRHELPVHMVSNSWMRIETNPLVKLVVVQEGPDAADDWIAERIGPSDIAVTADILLAARCLKAGAQCIGPTGKTFSDANIGMAVAMREMQRHLRETGESRGFNPSFTPRDRSQFLQALENAVQATKRKG
ncbi:YaiI/YqxD family protein [Hyphomicrobium sp.]|uniref:YaiI/YqxD family protein n=1 Tax=Hyphomicrobium sp. TaxID=82 RepID=UPI001D46C3EE|nr:YaiI/YqxD family protein [Hyphomicrobium sp.]MBY0562196.1 YaiI/YqxD family protein [Hyphomicrobium sp.]